MRTEVSLCLKLNLYLLIAISCSMSSMSCGVISLSSHKVNFSNYCHSDCHTGCQKENTLFIQGFVPINNDVFTAAESLVPASWVAIDDVNCDCSILPNHRLQLDFVDTKCDPAEASYQAVKSIECQIDEDQKVLFFFGGACSLETEPLATIAGNFYKIPTVSYGASSPSLSNRHLFPNFFRTIPSEIQANGARFALMEKYNWTKVATLHETESLFALAVEDFHHQYGVRYEQNNGLVLRSFTDTPEVQLQQIKDEDIRIIMGYFYEDKAIATLCLAYHMKLTTPSHVWILPAWYTRNWFYTDYHSNTSHISCTKDQLREAVKYSFFLDSYNESSNATNTGRTNSTEIFTEKLNCYLERFKDHPHTRSVVMTQLETHLYSGFAYDAVWTIAYALNKTEQELSHKGYNLTLDNFDYFEANNLSSIISRHLVETNFAGVSGPVIFDENGTRTGLTGIYQLRENPETMSDDELAQVLIAVYYPGLSRNSVSFEYLPGLEPVWKGGSQAPSDRKVPQKVYLNNGLIFSGYVFAGIGLIVAAVVLIFNIATLWKPLIKHSAPHMNSTVVFGCIVLLLGSLLLGIDSNHPVLGGVDLFHSHFAAICTLRLWILTLGFTMSFGALFCKMCLIFHVHINIDLKKKQPNMWTFMLMMIILIVLDAIFLIFWTIVFPFDFEEAVVSINDLTLEFEICNCDHFGFLIGALYLYKGLLTICGLFLAYESRNVKYFYINDSRFVSITMYIVVILVGIGAPLSLVLAVHYANDAAYEVAVLTIITACFSTLSILYIPKLYYIIKGEDCLIFDDDQDESTGSDGPRDSVVDARISQAVKNNLELDRFENSVCTNSSFYDRKASIAGKAVSDGNNPQIKVEDVTSPMTVRMRTACLGQ